MSDKRVKTHRKPANIRRIVQKIPDVLVGKAPDTHGLRKTFIAHFTHHIFRKISEAFEAKSRGSSDDLGNSWANLSPETIAGRPKPGRSTAGRGLLNAKQDRIWKGIYSSMLQRGKSPEVAAKLAWGIMKGRYGVRTKIDTLSRRNVQTMVSTGRLQKRLQPGNVSGARYHKKKNQVYEQTGTLLIIGTSVPYAERVHKKRPLWPDDIGPWINEANSLAVQAVVQRLQKVLT